jgi:hypothetical protein
MTRRGWFILGGAIGAVLIFAGAAVGGAVWLSLQIFGPAKPKKPLAVKLDHAGPYLILATAEAERDYAEAIAAARKLHPEAEYAKFEAGDLATAKEALAAAKPRYALLFMKPSELDVNFAWSWLALSAEVDDDPFVDVRTGFITGRDGAAAKRFVERIAAATRGEIKVPGKLIDNLGPNTIAKGDAFYLSRGAMMAPVFDERVALATISHGAGGYRDDKTNAMADAGILHFGGHGYPDCIVDGLKAGQVSRLELSPCVTFSGACYTGVTHRWFDRDSQGAGVAEKTAKEGESFCLNLLDNQSLGYLAALHPDHGIPVYQEMEHLAYTGGSLGDAIKHTHDGVILAREGGPSPAPLAAGQPWPDWSMSEVMLHGTAARVLFGDPALIVGEKFTAPPFAIETEPNPDRILQVTSLQVVATRNNSRLMSTYTDTYHSDLASDKMLFNDCARLVIDAPDYWDTVRDVRVISVTAGGEKIPHRLVAYGLEKDGDARRLHVQIDVAATGYMQSAFRSKKGTVVLEIEGGIPELVLPDADSPLRVSQ